jgi:uncharacterized membrane protein YidH (DUF202 family)
VVPVHREDAIRRDEPVPGVRTFAIVAIVLMVAVWIVLPLLVALAFAL